MAELRAAARNKLPKKDFGEPGSRKYPMPDKSHAVNAKGRAKQMLESGRISHSSYDKIVSKANRKLGKGSDKSEESYDTGDDNEEE